MANATAAASFDLGIQSLAQELRDLILEFTLIAAVQNQDVHVNSEEDAPYRPPWRLGFSSESKNLVAHAHYSTSIFTFHGARGDIWKWLRSVRDQDRRHIQQIRIYREWFVAPLRVSSYAKIPERLSVELSMIEHDLRKLRAWPQACILRGALKLGHDADLMWLTAEQCREKDTVLKKGSGPA